MAYLLSLAPPKSHVKASSVDIERIKEIVMESIETQGYLVVLGDKYLFWNEARCLYYLPK